MFTIYGHDILKTERQHAMVAKCIERAQRFGISDVKLYVNKEGPDGGWLEYLMVVEFSTYNLTIGCVQRTAGAEYEFHS